MDGGWAGTRTQGRCRALTPSQTRHPRSRGGGGGASNLSGKATLSPELCVQRGDLPGEHERNSPADERRHRSELFGQNRSRRAVPRVGSPIGSTVQPPGRDAARPAMVERAGGARCPRAGRCSASSRKQGPPHAAPRASSGDVMPSGAGCPQRDRPARHHSRDDLERSGLEEQRSGSAGGRRAVARSLSDARWPRSRVRGRPGPAGGLGERGGELCGPSREPTLKLTASQRLPTWSLCRAVVGLSWQLTLHGFSSDCPSGREDMTVQSLSERETVRPVFTSQRREVESPGARLALPPAVPHPVLPVACEEATASPLSRREAEARRCLIGGLGPAHAAGPSRGGTALPSSGRLAEVGVTAAGHAGPGRPCALPGPRLDCEVSRQQVSARPPRPPRPLLVSSS